MKKAILWGLVLFILSGVLFGVYKNNNIPTEKIGYALDTQIRLVIYDKNADEIIEKAYNEILRLDKLFSNFNKESETARLNNKKELTVSDELSHLIDSGVAITKETKGVYDLTVYPLSSIWNYKNEAVPSLDEINEALKRVDISNIQKEGNKVALKNDASIDVSSIAKGYIADYIIDFLKHEGIKNALVDAGGNIKVMGNSPKTKDGFTIGIKSPFDERGSSLGTINIKDTSIVTSGIYERNFVKDGRLYHHIIDIKTGYPSESDLASATIICKSSENADAYATAVLIMGSKKGMEFIKSNPSIEGILVTRNNEILVSDGALNFKEIKDESL